MELAWAAGFFDGEGSTTIQGTPRSPCLTVKLSQVDPRPIRRFFAAIGELGHLNGPYEQKAERGQPYYWWAANGRYAEAVIGLLWPFLSEPKREQWRERKTEVERRKRSREE